ncbi:TPA: hypothetical protein DDW35_13810 [Candidatus Sumerlaeota bacterium]|nr:hypothetical protein [Candidatus Sumerlaeota bacterium]
MSEILRILIVDDESAMRSVVRRVLLGLQVAVSDVHVNATFELDEASSGEEALEKIATNKPDLMLLDLKLPGISGLDVLEKLAENKTEVLVVMVTAYATIQTAVTATKQGAYDFLAKPFTPDDLRNTVRKATRHIVLQRQARQLAEEKRRVRFEFISVLAHELKAPISAVEGYVDTLEKDFVKNDPEIYDKVLERCRIRLEGMRKIINDLLDMTRMESGRKKRELIELDVTEVAKISMESIQPSADQKRIVLDLRVDGPVLLRADRAEMEIVLNNLISNAVKYNRDEGRVDVSIVRDDDHVVIRVEDTGIGLTEDEAAKLFNDFVRIKNNKTKDILGSGLGLSIVKKIAELYHGTAVVESEPDKGSVFTVTLGVTEAAE